MTCGYCGATNPEEEHRCLRCGRRLGSAAPAHQETLFRVIPFESIPPLRPEEGSRRRRPQPKEPPADQPMLGFETPAAAPASKPVVRCEAPVAGLRRRSEAVAVDFLMVLIAGAVFFGVFVGWTGRFPTGRTAALIYASAMALILLFYRMLSFMLADRSPATRMAGLCLLHFDGRPANRRQRLLRLAASCLSLAPLGIGFLWALVDEEHLTFHDHISETFPTPVEVKSRPPGNLRRHAL